MSAIGGRSLSCRMSLRPRPCAPNKGLRTSGPVSHSRRISARVARGLCKAKVGGVGIPCCCKRKLVAALSTQHSMLRAELLTGTPISFSACSRPRRSVTASNVPMPMARTKARSGNCGPKPGMTMPFGRRVSKLQAESRIGTQRAPCLAKARSISRACHSKRSTKSAICGAAGPAAAGCAAPKGGIKQILRDFAGAESLAAFERGDKSDRRTEQHRVDLVEILIEGFEDFSEGAAIVARIGARQGVGEFARRGGRAGDEKMRNAAVDDRVVGAAHGGNEIRMRRRERRAGDAVENIRQRKF